MLPPAWSEIHRLGKAGLRGCVRIAWDRIWRSSLDRKLPACVPTKSKRHLKEFATQLSRCRLPDRNADRQRRPGKYVVRHEQSVRTRWTACRFPWLPLKGPYGCCRGYQARHKLAPSIGPAVHRWFLDFFRMDHMSCRDSRRLRRKCRTEGRRPR